MLPAGHLKKLLAVAPEGTDAYLTLGTANYIIGSLPASKRFFLRFKGVRGNKSLGIKQMKSATSGRYLRPFAKILLALAALREKKPDVARAQLTELVAEFPQNPLFASELAKLNTVSPVPQSRSLGAQLQNSDRRDSRNRNFWISVSRAAR